MRVIIQRVSKAKVEVNNEVVGKINNGLLLYICFEKGDRSTQIDACVKKISKLRVFEDSDQRMNLAISQINGSLLSISQFTLSWDGQKGNRPSFENSMPPDEASIMYEQFNKRLRDMGNTVEEGIFGADMQVHSVNDGPVTINLKF